MASKQDWAPMRTALPTQHRLLPLALANTRFSKHFKFFLRRKGVLKAFPNYIEAFVILRDFHSPFSV